MSGDLSLNCCDWRRVHYERSRRSATAPRSNASPIRKSPIAHPIPGAPTRCDSNHHSDVVFLEGASAAAVAESGWRSESRSASSLPDVACLPGKSWEPTVATGTGGLSLCCAVDRGTGTAERPGETGTAERPGETSAERAGLSARR